MECETKHANKPSDPPSSWVIFGFFPTFRARFKPDGGPEGFTRMPQRLLRPGLKDSPHWNACDWITQSCYVRLLNVVDDYGRYEADPRILRGHCFAMREDVGLLAIDSICQQLSANKLVVFYDVDGKKFLQLTKWQERVRSSSKFPAPPEHLLTFASTCQQMIASPPSPSSPPSPTPTPLVNGELIKTVGANAPECVMVYKAYPRKVNKPGALKAIARAINKFGFDVVMSATQTIGELWRLEPCLKYCPHPSTWFNEERFNDDPSTWKPNNQVTTKPNPRNNGMSEDLVAKQSLNAVAMVAKMNPRKS